MKTESSSAIFLITLNFFFIGEPERLNVSHLDPGRTEKKNIFFFTLLWGASKGFMKAFKAFKAFIKPLEKPQRSVKIKIYANARGGKT